jgi:cytochrome P450
MTDTQTLFQQVIDPANRPDPYPLFARLRQAKVEQQPNGDYVVGSYADVEALLHDPRLSSDPETLGSGPPLPGGQVPLLVRTDPPSHDRLRRLATRPFGPPHTHNFIADQEPMVVEVVDGLIDQMLGRNQIDFVEEFAYPLPAAVISRVLGVPASDEARFRGLGRTIANSIGGDIQGGDVEKLLEAGEDARSEMRSYFEEKAAALEGQPPGTDLISRFVADDGPEGRLSFSEIGELGEELFVAGHEMLINLTSNSMLTLLRNPQVLQQVQAHPLLMPRVVEEAMRYESPLQMVVRIPLVEISVSGTIIPKGANLILLVAAANRDPERFEDPDRFDPERSDNQHLGMGSGIHYCFGAPLARIVMQVALTAALNRLQGARLVADPPAYKSSPITRGPSKLLLDVDTVL